MLSRKMGVRTSSWRDSVKSLRFSHHMGVRTDSWRDFVICSWLPSWMGRWNVDVTGIQRFHYPRHDTIHFPLRCEKGFCSPLGARQDVRYSFRGNLVFFHDLSSHCPWKNIRCVYKKCSTMFRHLDIAWASLGSDWVTLKCFSHHMGVLTHSWCVISKLLPNSHRDRPNWFMQNFESHFWPSKRPHLKNLISYKFVDQGKIFPKQLSFHHLELGWKSYGQNILTDFLFFIFLFPVRWALWWACDVTQESAHYFFVRCHVKTDLWQGEDDFTLHVMTRLLSH